MSEWRGSERNVKRLGTVSSAGHGCKKRNNVTCLLSVVAAGVFVSRTVIGYAGILVQLCPSSLTLFLSPIIASWMAFCSLITTIWSLSCVPCYCTFPCFAASTVYLGVSVIVYISNLLSTFRIRYQYFEYANIVFIV